MSPRDVVIEGATRTYNRADRENPNSDLHFCATCGCTTHWSASAGLIERMGGDVPLMAVTMRLLAPAQLRGLKLLFPAGRGWSGGGPGGYARETEIMSWPLSRGWTEERRVGEGGASSGETRGA